MSNDPASLPLLTVDVQHLGSRVLLTAAGEVDVGTSGDLQQVLHAACDSGAPEIWLDLTRMRFLECRGLHVLLDLHARLTEERRRLVLICPPGPVLRLLALTRARHEFEIHSTAPPAT